MPKKIVLYNKILVNIKQYYYNRDQAYTDNIL